MHILNLFVFFLFYTLPIFSCAHGRRVLHLPFFPMSSSWPPAQPPAVNFPKYPTSTNQRPFFPSYPTPRPPPPPPAAALFSSSSLPTFPANISSFISPASHTSTTKLLGAIAIPIISLALLSLVLFFFFFYRHRCRRRSVEDDEESDSDRLFPPNSAASDGRKPLANSGPVSSEFLYLGTLVNASGVAEGEAPSSSSPCQKLGSPELRPLPPLARSVRQGEGEGGMSSEEEFYSPSVSPGEMRNPVFSPALSFRAPEKHGSPVSTLSSPSYPSSNAASSPSPSSPTVSSAPFAFSPGRPANQKFQPPPPPPPPQPPLRPTTPIPSQWKPFSSSLSYSSLAKTQHLFSTQKLRSQWSIMDVPINSSVITLPPLPPSLPANGHMEKKMQNTSTAELCPTDPPQRSDILERSDAKPRPKLKPLHWDKVKATSDRAMIWDRMKSGSFQLNEEMIETLFVRDTKTVGIEEGRRLAAVAGVQENRLLDVKKSQNIAILLRALNVTKEEVCEALLDGNADSLGTDLMETLLRMAPSKEEELKLREHNDGSSFKLGPAERFLKALLGIPFAFKRVEAMLYIMNFDSEVHYLKESFQTLETACEELRSSRLFLKLLEAVLKTGNRMNVGTDRGDAQAFKLDTLLKLVDVRAADGKTNLLHFVVQEIIKAEGSRCHAANSSTAKPRSKAEEGDVECRRLGLRVISGLADDLRNVRISASLDSGALGNAVMRLAGGIGKVREVLRLNEALNPNEKNDRFHDSMLEFLKKAEVELVELQAQESVAVSLVKETTEYFHGNSAKEEAHPLRIFVIVRDFLGYLDQVCKEIGRANERLSSPMLPLLRSVRTGNSDGESL